MEGLASDCQVFQFSRAGMGQAAMFLASYQLFLVINQTLLSLDVSDSTVVSAATLHVELTLLLLMFW